MIYYKPHPSTSFRYKKKHKIVLCIREQRWNYKGWGKTHVVGRRRGCIILWRTEGRETRGVITAAVDSGCVEEICMFRH
jgi:hypothetical protein